MACQKSYEKLELIKINPEHKVKGFYTLLTNGSVRCLSDEQYVVPKHCLEALIKEKVKFDIVNPHKE